MVNCQGRSMLVDCWRKMPMRVVVDGGHSEDEDNALVVVETVSGGGGGGGGVGGVAGAGQSGSPYKSW